MIRDAKRHPNSGYEFAIYFAMIFRPTLLKVSNDRLAVYGNNGSSTSSRIEIELRPVAYPILKWAGGKQWLAAAARHLVPPLWNGRYYEPFVGGGSFFFAIGPEVATLSDKNQELITTYKAVREDPEAVIRLLRTYPYNKKFYYQLRARSPRVPHAIAARLLYLNKTCWNGLYRVNREGKFNTPFGKFKNPTICNSDRLLTASRLLQTISLNSDDFGDIVSSVESKDFVYFDPPYVTGHQNNGFLKYNRQLFSWNDQERLAKLAIQLANLHVNVLVSNADHPAVIELYKGFNYYRIRRQSLIGGQEGSRGKISEALLSSYPLLEIKTEVIQ